MPRQELRAKVRDYTDQDGTTRPVYAAIGSLWTDEHNNVTGITIDTIPVNWNGKAFVNERKDKEEATL